MGFVPFVVVISGVIFLILTLNYHTFKNYRNIILDKIAKIQDIKKKIRKDVDELEFLSVPEIQGICENMCGYLTGKMESQDLTNKMKEVNQAFSKLYNDSESKHIQDEILKSINREIVLVAQLNKELKDSQYAYNKLLNEKPYSMIARWMNFEPVQIPWEKANAAATIAS